MWHEPLAGGELDNKQFNDFITSGPLTEFYDNQAPRSARPMC